jgi:hypothetical protein
MKKELAIAALLIAMIAASALNIRALNRLTESVAVTADSALLCAESGDWDGARRLAQSAADEWDKSERYTHVVLRHSEIQAVDDAISELVTQTYCEDRGGTLGAARALSICVRRVAAIERVRPGSVF